MPIRETNATLGDPATTALRALAWIVSNDDRAGRFLGLTGIAPDDLRARADEPALLDAVLGFLEGHEPDLFACADALGTTPAALVAVRHQLAVRA